MCTFCQWDWFPRYKRWNSSCIIDSFFNIYLQTEAGCKKSIHTHTSHNNISASRVVKLCYYTDWILFAFFLLLPYRRTQEFPCWCSTVHNGKIFVLHTVFTKRTEMHLYGIRTVVAYTLLLRWCVVIKPTLIAPPPPPLITFPHLSALCFIALSSTYSIVQINLRRAYTAHVNFKRFVKLKKNSINIVKLIVLVSNSSFS